ncbi:winged helix-turn-helix transcriptional regulator [Actinomadura rubrisoli]|uniref:Transcriptional regulator n=1 Tax=Actinomadura rubrisoli TaxID=2530368 RepID=A0A4R5AGT0_9ACTN|nr:helix-turn-helix domain-containing protein [Actinomadura rubrisoli]TDD70600.1 transcriptional regulator [Actinomadura rubrisoli]
MRQPLDPDMFAGCRASGASLIRIGDKWTSRVIRCLESGPRRFSEIQVPLRGVTPKVLTETLRAMERDGLVERTVYAERPPRVEYTLTPLGHTLREPMAAGCAWSEAHLPEVMEAREAHERSSLVQDMAEQQTSQR